MPHGQRNRLSDEDQNRLIVLCNVLVVAAQFGDWESYARQYAPDAVLVVADGSALHGRDAIHSYVATGGYVLELLFSLTKDYAMRGVDGMAWQRAAYDLKPEVAGPGATAMRLTVFELDDTDEWMVAADSWTVNRPDEAGN